MSITRITFEPNDDVILYIYTILFKLKKYGEIQLYQQPQTYVFDSGIWNMFV